MTATNPTKGRITTVRFNKRTLTDTAGKTSALDRISVSEILTFVDSNMSNSLFTNLNAPHDEQHNQHNYNQSNASARTVAPISAMAPGGQRPEQQKYQEHNQNRRNGNHFSSSSRKVSNPKRGLQCR